MERLRAQFHTTMDSAVLAPRELVQCCQKDLQVLKVRQQFGAVLNHKQKMKKDGEMMPSIDTYVSGMEPA